MTFLQIAGSASAISSVLYYNHLLVSDSWDTVQCTRVACMSTLYQWFGASTIVLEASLSWLEHSIAILESSIRVFLSASWDPLVSISLLPG